MPMPSVEPIPLPSAEVRFEVPDDAAIYDNRGHVYLVGRALRWR